MADDAGVVDGDDYFDAAVNGDTVVVEPESNGDATPVGDVDSEANLEVGDSIPASEDYDAAEGDLDTAEGESDDDAVGEEEVEWLPGFEGRFRPGEEDKALDAYRNLEAEYSRRQNEFREQLQAEREAAFQQAQELIKAQQPQRSIVSQLQERQQLQALAYSDPGTAFRAALETGDEGTIDAVIQAVAQGDMELGIDGDYGAALQMQGVVQELKRQNEQQSLAQQVQELRTQAVINPAAQQFRQQYSSLLENEQIAGAFQQTLSDNWNQLADMSDVSQVNAILERSLQQAIGHVAMTQQFAAPPAAQASGEPQQQTQRPAKPRPHTEGAATRPTQREEKRSEEDEYADDILAAARAIKPVY